MTTRCRTFIFVCLLIAWSAMVVFSFSWLLLFFFITRRGNQVEALARRMLNIYGRGCMFIISPWVKVRTENLHLLSPPCIIVANHLSMLDLTCLPFLPSNNLCLMVKSWPAKMPFMGLFVRKANYINVDELSFAKVRERIDEEIMKKSVIVVFPEGSRSPDGKLKRLRPGAFRLAIATGLPIYPLRYTGTNQAFPKGGVTIYPAQITMRLYDRILPPIINEELNDHWAHKRLSHQARACLQEAA